MHPPVEPKSEHPFLRMRRIPAGEAIEKDLDLRGALSLQQIGDGLRVAGSFWIGGAGVGHRDSTGGAATVKCPGQCQLSTLPEYLAIDQDFHFHACSRVTSFPQTMRVGGNLFLNGLARLNEIPEGVLKGRRLSIKGCPLLVRLPGGLGPLEQLILDGTGVVELPDDLQMAPGAELILQNCARLRTLPATIMSSGSLARIVIRNCPQLEALPDLAASRQIVIERLRIAEISSGLRAEHVRVSRCAQLSSVTGPIETAKLAFSHCLALTQIPTPVGALVSLSLWRCKSLPELPSSLCFRPGGRTAQLDVSGCAALTTLRPDLKVEGQQNCPALRVSVGGSGVRSAPNYPFDWRVEIHGAWFLPRFFFHLDEANPAEILLYYWAAVRRELLNCVGVANLIARTEHEVLDEDSDSGGPRRLYRILLQPPIRANNRTYFRQTRTTLLGRSLMKLFLWPFRPLRNALRTAAAAPPSATPPVRPGMLDGRYLQCRCPTTKREYLLAVPRQVLTCHDAAAWLAGLDPKDYAPVQET